MSPDDLYEELSRLLSDDLPAERAEALRRRIEEEPEVARAWADLQAVAGGLEGLADEAPPAALDRRVLASREASEDGFREESMGVAARPRSAGPVTPAPRGGEWTDRTLLRWAPWAMAACLALALFWPRSQPDLVLAEGRQLVEGHVHVLAGDVPVEVDGVAWITVEPPAGSLRVSGQEVDMMDRKTLLAAVAGAAVTVAVLEGYALISDAGDTPARVEAGETRSVGQPARARASERSRVLAPRATPDLKGASPEDLMAEIDRLQAENDGLRLKSTLAQGQAEHYEGVPQEWDDGIPAGFRPDAFTDAMRTAVEGMEDAELLDVDCEEFPCVAVIRSTTDRQDWAAAIDEGLPAAADLGLEGEVGKSIWAHGTRGDEGEVRLAGVAFVPKEQYDEDAHQRTDFRAGQLFEDLSGELLEQEAGAEDP